MTRVQTIPAPRPSLTIPTPACSTEGMRRIECQECGRLLCYADALPAGRGIELKCRCKAVTLAWGDGRA